MKVSRIWLAAIGLIILVTTTLYMVGAEIIAPNFDAHLPYLAILVLAWVFCVPSILSMPKLIARKGHFGEAIRIDTSRRTLAMLAIVLCIGLIPAQPFTTLMGAIFGKLLGVGIALTLASTFKQSQKFARSEDHG